MRALGGPFPSVHANDNDDNNNDHSMVTEISHFVSRIVGGSRGLKLTVSDQQKAIAEATLSGPNLTLEKLPFC